MTHAEPARESADARIARLVEEARATLSPNAWERVDALVRAIVELYGDALARLLAAIGELGDDTRQALADDDLVASVLLLHGLHPLPVDARVRRALEAVAAQLGPVELVAIDGAVARLRVRDAPRADGVAETLERLVLDAAPELESVEVEGLRARAAGGPLVTIDLSRSRAGTGR